ncbi:hypothetical protein BPODLACK_04648 [Gordonia sp. YY1]|uniref:Uncharacterized protein n=1 Tax=Klebsiella phage KP13-2 TaxID=2985659 RepID=A0AAX3DC54_9CAUD|nr:hypothetical protein BPODLACK_04648 [Gordonia sp. YY1]UYL04595.1 hypothetical protein NFBINONH_00051 [Klebsiella phage KP13-2]
MADLSSTRMNSSLENWGEQLELIVELNGKSFDITESEIEAAYYAGKRVDDFYYEEWEPE